MSRFTDQLQDSNSRQNEASYRTTGMSLQAKNTEAVVRTATAQIQALELNQNTLQDGIEYLGVKLGALINKDDDTKALEKGFGELKECLGRLESCFGELQKVVPAGYGRLSEQTNAASQSQLNKIQTLIDSNTAATAAMQKGLSTLATQFQTLPKKITSTITLETPLLVEKLGDMMSAIEAIDVAPKVTVKAPQVTVDLAPITNGLAAVKTAVEGIEKPEPVDNGMVIEGLLAVQQAIQGLRFPIPNFIQDPLIRYRVADVDDAATTKYYGYVDPEGKWYIMREITATSPKTYRYCFGGGGNGTEYPSNWSNRASLTYDLYYSRGM